MEKEAREWIEAVIGEPIEGTLQEGLKSGVVLCKLINTLKAGSVKKVNKMKMPFMQMENISAYLSAVGPDGLGIPAFEMFQTIDLYEDQNMGQVVLNIHSLGRKAQSFYSGATLGAKMATANKREFTEEQMNAGKNTVGVFGKGSHASAQADAKAKLGGGDDGAASPTAPPPAPLQKQPSKLAVPLKSKSFIESGLATKAEYEEAIERGPPATMAATMVELVKRVSVEELPAEEVVATARESPLSVTATGDPETDARVWIEAVLGEPLGDGTMHEALKSGVVLCNLANKISPGCCPKPSTKKLPFMQMENISNYLAACVKTFAIPAFESFMTVDLYEEKNMGQVVLNIHALGRVTQSIASFNGPSLGAKMATANKREFTEEQMNAGKNTVGVFGKGSHASAQADAKAKLGA